MLHVQCPKYRQFSRLLVIVDIPNLQNTIIGKENSNDILYLLRIESFSHNMTIRDKLIITMLFYLPTEMDELYLHVIIMISKSFTQTVQQLYL